MPKNNRFRHQVYTADIPSSLWHFIDPGKPVAKQEAEFSNTLHQVGRWYRQSQVAAVFLLHGTFAGNDAFGLLRSLSHVFPQLGERAKKTQKQTLDRFLKDAGNYAAEYATELQRGIDLPVYMAHWSSENHHLARADAAVRLIDRIAELNLQESDRVLLWGHSHGGNVFAVMTNLLGGDHRDRTRFFRACRSYYQAKRGRVSAVPHWYRVQELLSGGRPKDTWPHLDFVTFGTPIRYGWDTDGYSKLLHFVHHHPDTESELPIYRTAMPRSAEEVMAAVHGDYIQHWGIAGTNLAPNLFARRTWLADHRLGRLLQRGVRSRDLWNHLKLGMRVPDEGETLLVNYPPVEDEFPLNFAGHSVYTRMRWMPFHALEIARRFYTPAIGDESTASDQQ